jgi:hypothetical protein
MKALLAVLVLVLAACGSNPLAPPTSPNFILDSGEQLPPSFPPGPYSCDPTFYWVSPSLSVNACGDTLVTYIHPRAPQ